MNRRPELAEFLRTRRARLHPDDVGLPPGSRRRTPGLRREEVAVLAGVGVSWYTWLEQGRDIGASPQVLDAIARALRLNPAERRHLHVLTGLPAPTAEPVDRPVEASLQRFIDGWLPRPAYVIDRHWNFLALNRAAEVVFGHGVDSRNCLYSFFTDVRQRVLVPEWSANARQLVGLFRAEAALFPGDPRFAEMADDLSAVSEEFAALWATHDVAAPEPGLKAVHHPAVGDLLFETVTLDVPSRPGDRLMLYNPVPEHAERLDRLILVAADPG
ncbi:transcriptional regulator [Actinorhabdospora filicis]|uniref:Transcriptional regulator n=1 Tax=Actinorhabdospora filicis TaxID=1785913 RepID=A0A9W6WCM3_9ACTN|nr:helix-turn-helix transcriptional regulator [Actinorhabdospora filicis]GLZ81233.1 transcriptional regulator [Actinorhabdospora filicis]